MVEMSKNRFIFIAIIIQLILSIIVGMFTLGSYLTGKYGIETIKENAVIESYYNEINKLSIVGFISVLINIGLWLFFWNLFKTKKIE